MNCVHVTKVTHHLLQAWVHGFRRFAGTWIHSLDLSIVIISLVLEVFALAAKVSATGVGGLLVLFRLWRVVRVMHAVREVQHKAARDHTKELEELLDKLKHMSSAHREVVKALHKEFVRRVCSHAAVLSSQRENFS